MQDIKAKSIQDRIYRDVFIEGSWSKDTNISSDGNCFFECISKAINLYYPQGKQFTPLDVREVLAATVTEENYNDIVRDYVVNAPTSDIARVYDQIKSPSVLKEFIRSPLHYATIADIRMIERLLEAHIIVLNGIYNPDSEDYSLRSPIYGHYPDRADYNNYIILIHGGEHFELVLGSQNRTIHGKSEVPPRLLQLYENTMAE